jgi:hypothetical protein
VRTVP